MAKVIKLFEKEIKGNTFINFIEAEKKDRIWNHINEY